MVSLDSNTILAEIDSIKVVVDKWVSKLETSGLPSVDSPGSVVDLGQMLEKLIGEMRLVSGKAINLAEVIATSELE